jgi:hypothetical protein
MERRAVAAEFDGGSKCVDADTVGVVVRRALIRCGVGRALLRAIATGRPRVHVPPQLVNSHVNSSSPVQRSDSELRHAGYRNFATYRNTEDGRYRDQSIMRPIEYGDLRDREQLTERLWMTKNQEQM